MKKNILTALTFAGLSFAAMAQKFFEPVNFTGAFPALGTPYTAKIEGTSETWVFSNGDWTTGWTEWFPNKRAYPAPTSTLEGDVTTDRSLSGTVELKGTVHVINGATLTIAPGTVIRAGLGATLIIAKGSKINAVGTRENPIVFTSNKPVDQRAPGDWAGILLIGNSQVNTADGTRQYEALPNDPTARYGGGRGSSLNLADNSGEMRFVRVEFAGYNYLPDQELNGLTLGACGSGTRVNFIQVSYARDDSFEWFGGTSNHKYLVALGGVDDDFDMDEGYAGKVQFILGVRNPAVFETAAGGTSNGFEHDNNTGLGSASAVVPGNNNPTPNTKPIVSNATLIGPWVNGAPTSGNKFGRGLEMRSAVATSIYNSLVIGYNTGVQLVHPSVSVSPSVQERLQNGEAEYTNVHFFLVNTGPGAAFVSSSNSPIAFGTGVFSTYLTTRGTQALNTPASTLFHNIITNFNNSVPGVSYSLAASSPINGVPATFSGIYASIIEPFVGDVSLNPVLFVDKNSVVFPTRRTDGTSAPITINVTNRNLTVSSINIVSSNPDFQPSVTTLSTATGSFTISFNKNTAGVSTGTITVSAQGITQIINVSGTVVAPSEPFLAVDISSATLTATETTAPYTSASKMMKVSGRELGAPITVSGTANVKVSLDNTNFSTSVVFNPNLNGLLTGTGVYFKLETSVGANQSDMITIASSGAQSISVEVSFNTSPRMNIPTSAVIDYYQGMVVTATSTNMSFSVSGDRITAPNVEVRAISGDILFALASGGPYNPSVTLPVSSGVLPATSVWMRYNGTIAGTTNGVQVGTFTITGDSRVIAASIRQTDANSTIFPATSGYILAQAGNTVVTALGFDPTLILRSGSAVHIHIAASGNPYLGRVSSVTSTAIILSSGSARSSSTATGFDFPNLAITDNTVDIITITGTISGGDFPSGLPIYTDGGEFLGNVVSVLNIAPDANVVKLDRIPTNTYVSEGIRTSASKYRRSNPTISLSPGSPIDFNVSQITSATSPTPVIRVITLTGENHNHPVRLRINPALASSGYMFEINAGTQDASTFTSGIYNVTVPVLATGRLNTTVTIRYNPALILTRPELTGSGLNVLAAHTTEMEVLGDNQASVSSARPRFTFAVNLRGNAQPGPVSPTTPIVSNSNGDAVTALAPFTTYRGLVSKSQTFRVRFSRAFNDVTITSPDNFFIRELGDATWVNSLTITPVSNAVDKTIEVAFLRSTAGSDNGAIQVATPAVATQSINVSGNAIDFTSILNLDAAGATVISFTGASQVAMLTVNGASLTENVTITAPAGFKIGTSASSINDDVVVFSIVPSDFGDLEPTTVYLTNGSTTTPGAVDFKASSGAVNSNIISLVIVNTIVSNIITFEEIPASTLFIYPNPTENGQVTIVASAGSTINVYDYAGNLVRSVVAEDNSTQLTGLTPGLYFVRVGSKTLKLIVK